MTLFGVVKSIFLYKFLYVAWEVLLCDNDHSIIKIAAN